MLVFRRRDSVVDFSVTSFIVLDLLGEVQRQNDNCYRGYTAREALKIALIRDDFPIPDCYGTTMNRGCSRNNSSSYPTDDKDPESAIHPVQTSIILMALINVTLDILQQCGR